VPYDHASNATPPSPEAYGAMVKRTVGDIGCKFTFEPGRVIVGNAGIMVSRVVSIKESTMRRFVILDAAMNDLVRPAMYGARHEILPVVEPPMSTGAVPVDVVGPVCESGDFFAQDRPVPPLAAGDYLALMSSGAYGFVMASNYNSRPLPAEVLVEGNLAHLVRKRQGFPDLIAGEMIPA
jgi:diaminopimelate decarboxylase